jgi:hypothetical protein
MKNRNIFRLTLYLLLLIGLFLPFITQAEEEIQESQYLSKAVLCKDVEEKEPVFETTSFRVWDEKAVSWIRFTYQSQEPFMITWEWVDPEGKIYHVGEIQMEAGDYKNYRTWYWINIQDHYAANLLGDWKIRISVDNILLAVKDFSIEL